MFDWLFEGRPVVYSLLGAVAFAFLLAWWRTRKRGFLIAVGALVALAGLYFLLGKLVDTPRGQIERKVNEMAAAVRARDTEGIFKHVAADFRFRGQDRATFHKYVEGALQRQLIDELEVWDFRWPEGGDDHTRAVEFYAKPKGGLMTGSEAFYLVKATFVREADGQWRLKSFDVYNPAVDTNRPIDLPGLP